jgi:hypothetical protein
LPIEVAKSVRGGQRGSLKYDVAKTAEELCDIMRKLKIRDYNIVRPKLNNEEGVNYGIWVEFRK